MPDLLDLVYLALYLFIWSAIYTGCFSLGALALRSHALGFSRLSERERYQLHEQARRDAQERLDAERLDAMRERV
jgi:hypothetical protein